MVVLLLTRRGDALSGESKIKEVTSGKEYGFHPLLVDESTPAVATVIGWIHLLA